MFFFDTEPIMAKLADIAEKYNASVIAVQKVASEDIHAYGIIKINKKINNRLFEVADIVEKPKTKSAAPSNYAIMGRYVLAPEIFDAIEKITPTSVGEIQLSDALAYLAKNGHPVLAYEIDATFFDIGRPLGWLCANLYLGMQFRDF